MLSGDHLFVSDFEKAALFRETSIFGKPRPPYLGLVWDSHPEHPNFYQVAQTSIDTFLVLHSDLFTPLPSLDRDYHHYLEQPITPRKYLAFSERVVTPLLFPDSIITECYASPNLFSSRR